MKFLNIPGELKIPTDPKWIVQVDQMIHRLRNPMVDTPDNEKILTSVPKSLELVKPEKGSLNSDQLQKFFKDTLKFSAIPMIAFLTAVSAGKSPQDAFSYALVPAFLNALINFFTKLNSDEIMLRKKD